jgi:hypothetical protein
MLPAAERQELKPEQCIRDLSSQSRAGVGGACGWHLGGLPSLLAEGLTLLPHCSSSNELRAGGREPTVNGFQMGYQVCPQSTGSLLWSLQLPQLWFSCPANARNGMPLKLNPLLSMVSPSTPLLSGIAHFSLSFPASLVQSPPEVERVGAGNLADSWGSGSGALAYSYWEEVAV